MSLLEGICALGLLWSIWKGYQEGLFGVLLQWFGLAFSLALVGLMHQSASWQVWARDISGTDQGSWVQWGLLVGILLGVQLVLMALNALISKFFKIIGLETAYRWGGAMLALLKWVVILSLVFHLIAQIPGGSSVLKSKFPWSAAGLIAMGKAIWTMGTSFF